MSTEKSPYPAGGATAPPASGGYQGYPPPQQQAYSGQQQYTGQQQYPSQQPEPQEAPPSYQTASALPPLRTTNAYYAENFNDKSIRRGFIRKVYLILTLQLAVTIGLVSLMLFVPAVNDFAKNSLPMYISCLVIFIVAYLVMMCVPSLRRKVPHNFITLGVFTLALSYMVGVISCRFDINTVLIALGITGIVTLGVTLFSCQTKFDLTLMNGLLFCLAMVVFTFGFFMIFMHNRVVYLIYASLGALLFTLFLAYDTQLIMGGKRYELDPEEYIFGALTLYTDVLYIFIFILGIVGNSG